MDTAYGMQLPLAASLCSSYNTIRGSEGRCYMYLRYISGSCSETVDWEHVGEEDIYPL